MTLIEKEFSGFIEELGCFAGLPSGLSPLFSILYIQPQEISMEELAQKSGYSLASVSLKVQQLVRLGLVIRRKRPGTNKVFLFVEKHLVEYSLGNLIDEKERLVASAKTRLPGLIERLSRQKLGQEEEMQLKNIRGYYRECLEMESLIKKLRIWLDELKGVL